MKFVGGPKSPAKPYKVGEVYELPPRYARFPWFRLLTESGEAKEKQTMPEKPEEKTLKSESEEFELAFEGELASHGLSGRTVGEEPVDLDDIEAPLEGEPEEKSRSQLERMKKAELVSYIKAKGGEADESQLKAVLVEAALAIE